MAANPPTPSDVFQTYAQLSGAEQRFVVQTLQPPSQRVNGILWIIVVSVFGVVLIGGLGLIAALVINGDDTEAIVPIVTASLGVLAGLLAPSPS